MSTQAVAIYEKGVLRLLTPVSLPESARVRVQILSDDEPEDELRRAETVLIAAGLVRPASSSADVRTISKGRRAELARIYAAEVPSPNSSSQNVMSGDGLLTIRISIPSQ